MRLKDTALFKDMSEQVFKTVLSDYQLFPKKYGRGENIPLNKNMGIILGGELTVLKNDESGGVNIIEFLTEGELVPPGDEGGTITVLCNKPTEIVYFDYRRIIEKAPKTVVNRLFRMMAEKNERQNMHINVLCGRSIRKKIERYLEMLCVIRKSKKVKLPFSFSTLADYLAVDRSAMTREIKKMKDEELISAEKRVISVLWDVEW